MAEQRIKRLSESEQLSLGEIKLKLEAISDKSKPIVYDFGMKPAECMSWRGSYCELGLGYSESGGGTTNWNSEEVEWASDDGEYISYKQDEFQLPPNPTAQNFLDMLNAVTGKVMVGYKGGDFTMHKNVAVYLGNYGEPSVVEYKGEDYATVAIFDIIEEPEVIIIVTDKVEY